MNKIIIKNDDEFLAYLNGLINNNQRLLALDLEAENNLHVYGEKLCLIQIFDGTNIIIADPLNIKNSNLKDFFENRDILKVMYDSPNDSYILKNANNIGLKSILDLRPAVELLDYDKKDLHSIISFELHISLEKKRTFQRYNWIRRPLSEEAINYAMNDVLYLLRLKDIIFRKLYRKKLLDTFMLLNLRIQNKDYTKNPYAKYRNIKGYHSLPDEEKSLLRKAVDVREKYAKMFNMPPFHLFSKEDLYKMLKDPNHINEIHFPKTFRQDTIHKIISELTDAVKSTYVSIIILLTFLLTNFSPR